MISGPSVAGGDRPRDTRALIPEHLGNGFRRGRAPCSAAAEWMVVTRPPWWSPKGDNARMSERHAMRKVREVLRLRFEVGCSHRALQASTGLSKGSVSEYLKRATARGLTWPEAQSISDADVEAYLFRAIGRSEPHGRTPIDFAWVHTELRRPG
jgi:hypothetical protein